MRELIIDNFAGGGGASTGIELAIGRSVDIAINHSPEAIAMHKTNHPSTKHYCESVWDVDPLEATGGQPVSLAWFSPDCKHFSKAKGGKPKDKSIRGLAWIVLKWAGKVKPRVIILENVEEFQTWGPLKKGRPIKTRKGETFEKWKEQLQSLGYVVDHRELKACDYGAPTTRKRFFLIARCDGKKIVWPEPTHAPSDSLEVMWGLKEPYRTAADIIDWSIPCPSIFDRKKPLSENTLKRIARGIQKFVIEHSEPFIIQYHSYGDNFRGQGLDKPLMTLDTSNRYALVTPFITKFYKTGIGQEAKDPLHTITTSAGHFGLVSAFISKSYAGESRSIASSLHDGLHTITARNCFSLVEVALKSDVDHSAEVQELLDKYYGKPVFGDKKINDKAFLLKYYGQGTGQGTKAPLDTVTTKDRFGLVTIKGEDYRIVDIGMRMLQPRELFNAQGFPEEYIIEHDYRGKAYPKTEQVARCGNAVPPPFAKVLVQANLPELCKKEIEEAM